MDAMLTFLKLGGSLITDKDIPYSARKQTIKRLGIEIFTFLKKYPQQKILIGHGSGSFGHTAAANLGTIHGARSLEEWRGFQSVWWAAHQLNQIVCEIFLEVGLPIISLPASASVLTLDRSIIKWTSYPIKKSIQERLLPILYGDVIFDQKIGATILSTEELFSGLVGRLQPHRILLVGKDAGVYKDFPHNKLPIKTITPESYQRDFIHLGKSENTDVTGGMAAKVKEMLEIVQNNVKTQVQIFSGDIPGNVFNGLSGEHLGTIITAS